MSETNPKFIPTQAQRDLEAAAEQYRARLEAAGHAGEVEKADHLVARLPDNVLNLADAIEPAMGVFKRMEEKSKAFFAEVRQSFDQKATLRCTVHPFERLADFELTCQATREAGTFTMAFQSCPACVKEEKDSRRRGIWAHRGMPQRVIDASFSNFETNLPDKIDALNKVRAWCKRRGNFLLLTGTPGTGKGHLAAACLRVAGAGLWIEHVAMLGDLRASYTLHTTKDLIEKWQEAEMLVLDEFGLSPGGKDEEPLLYQVLADRYDKRRPTIITSNLDKPKLREAVGYRLLDRLREDCCEVAMNWASYRTGK